MLLQETDGPLFVTFIQIKHGHSVIHNGCEVVKIFTCTAALTPVRQQCSQAEECPVL